MNLMNNKGLTLPELMIGIAITAVIGLSVAGVTMVLSTGNAQAQASADIMQTSQLVSLQLGRQVRGALLVTASDSTRLVLWNGDGNGNNVINLDELTVISYDSSKKELRQYQVVFPSYWSDWQKAWMNSQLSLSWSYVSNAASAETYLRSQWYYCQTTVLASDVTSFQFAVEPAAPITTLVKAAFVTGTGDNAQKVSTAVNLRADRTSDVLQVGKTYYLSGE
jgi:prepilin-type N-terminal cleavage/methylation domain-containing protein